MENKDGGKLGLVACIAILTGGCIGSAIFSLSGMTMYYAGPAAIITWIVAAIILGCYGVQVAELSVRYPHSGGVYVFPAKSLGKFWGYLAAWGYIISNFIAVAFSAIYVATYLGVGFEALSGLQIPLALAASYSTSERSLTPASSITSWLACSLSPCWRSASLR